MLSPAMVAKSSQSYFPKPKWLRRWRRPSESEVLLNTFGFRSRPALDSKDALLSVLVLRPRSLVLAVECRCQKVW